MERKKQLHECMNDIILSPLTEPVCMGELAIALNVMERLKEQAPGMHENMLKMANGEL